jgi:hypothetical protein
MAVLCGMSKFVVRELEERALFVDGREEGRRGKECVSSSQDFQRKLATYSILMRMTRIQNISKVIQISITSLSQEMALTCDGCGNLDPWSATSAHLFSMFGDFYHARLPPPVLSGSAQAGMLSSALRLCAAAPPTCWCSTEATAEVIGLLTKT